MTIFIAIVAFSILSLLYLYGLLMQKNRISDSIDALDRRYLEDGDKEDREARLQTVNRNRRMRGRKPLT